MDNAGSYLSILLNDIEQTKNFLAAYNNQILFTQAKYPSKELDDNIRQSSKVMGESEKIQLINTIGYFRTYSTRAYISFNSIKNKFNASSSELIGQIEESYNTIKKTPIPDYDSCERFVQGLSDVTVKEINVQALVNTEQKARSLAQASESPDLD